MVVCAKFALGHACLGIYFGKVDGDHLRVGSCARESTVWALCLEFGCDLELALGGAWLRACVSDAFRIL